MRRKGHIVNRYRRQLPNQEGENLLFADDLPRYEIARNADTLIKLVQMNPYNKEILKRMHLLDAPDCWLVSGCLFQTVWNVVEGRHPCDGILDYDIIYYDPDQSREAEEVMTIRAGALFSDLDVKIQIKNQSRVHMWYEPKFGLPYPELKSAAQSLRYYPSKVQAIALQGRGSSRIAFDAPFGFENILRLIVRPNHALEFPDIYEAKTKRWKDIWPNLEIHPWA
ncbi:nucleotidyltransferase family protein [Terasakiella sp. SH-1]|uniref:nucleotidyltransferase family protein n=1 Tax=Terasakiella sp. SH-1 TaxID=2560057 RepID=UPI00142FA1F8|nr:nucleotidyltransferase family protein [Terasakiella sp. SH-1]